MQRILKLVLFANLFACSALLLIVFSTFFFPRVATKFAEIRVYCLCTQINGNKDDVRYASASKCNENVVFVKMRYSSFVRAKQSKVLFAGKHFTCSIRTPIFRIHIHVKIKRCFLFLRVPLLSFVLRFFYIGLMNSVMHIGYGLCGWRYQILTKKNLYEKPSPESAGTIWFWNGSLGKVKIKSGMQSKILFNFIEYLYHKSYGYLVVCSQPFNYLASKYGSDIFGSENVRGNWKWLRERERDHYM